SLKSMLEEHKNLSEGYAMISEMAEDNAEDAAMEAAEEVISPEEKKKLEDAIEKIPDIDDAAPITKKDIAAVKDVANPTAEDLVESMQII
ncbi:hypothetical protein V6O07_11435, partial [Arthrospira platensis SPKY2]